MIYNILEASSEDEAVKKPEGTAARETNAEKGSTPISSEDNPSNSTSTSKDSKSASDLMICTNCNLPRLKYPRIGLTSRPPPDPNAQYCANEPPVVLAGHDVHGNAFPGFKPKPNTATTASKSTKTTKSKSTTKKSAAAATETSSPTTSQDSPPSSETPKTTTTTTTTTTTAAAAGTTSSTSLEYPQIRTPQMKCPNNCGQWKNVNAMAKHLDACLLGKGRKAGREARERIGAGSNTPAEGASRSATPLPKNGGVKRRRGGGEEETGNGSGSGIGKVEKKAKKAK
jgi:hypothetical protein